MAVPFPGLTKKKSSCFPLLSPNTLLPHTLLKKPISSTGDVFHLLTNPILLYSDSQAAIVLSHGGSYHTHKKHIDIQYHFILFVINNGTINLIYLPYQ
jgi:hypothetical protein